MSDNDFSYHSAEDAAGLPAGVAIFADRAGVRHEMAEDMEGAGFRVLRNGPLQELLEGEATGLGDVVLLDCVSVDVKLCAALSRLDMRIARSGAQLIVTDDWGAWGGRAGLGHFAVHRFWRSADDCAALGAPDDRERSVRTGRGSE